MPDFNRLDEQRRLTPWFIPDHAGFVRGHYGSLLSTPEKAQGYLDDYEKKQKEHILAYEKQRELLRSSSSQNSGIPQELPDLEFIDWDPRPAYNIAVPQKEEEANIEEEVSDAPDAEDKPKRGRPKKVVENE